MKYYRLVACGDYQMLAADEQSRTQIRALDHELLKNPWSPPRVEAVYYGPSGKSLVADTAQLLGLTVFSRRAVEVLRDLLLPHGELLPLACKEGDYYVFNVTRIVDALDNEASEFWRFSSGRIMKVVKHVFLEDRVAGVPIFKVPETGKTETYVTERFKERAESGGLVGLEFRQVYPDPADRLVEPPASPGGVEGTEPVVGASGMEHPASGEPILRHETRQPVLEPVVQDPGLTRQIATHVERAVGKISSVYHELIPDVVHVDINVVAPSRKRNYYTLVTSGMSARPMNAFEGNQGYRFAELMLCLPPTWNLSEAALEDERNYWPIRVLKTLARLPHQCGTWLFYGHTVPNGAPAVPFAQGTDLRCSLLVEPLLFADDLVQMKVDDQKTVWFLSLIPIHQAEMDFKLREGLYPLVDRLEGAGVTELLDPRRKSVC